MAPRHQGAERTHPGDTARWLAGQRHAEPAVRLIAYRLGFTAQCEIEQETMDFIRDLADILPPLQPELERTNQQHKIDDAWLLPS